MLKLNTQDLTPYLWGIKLNSVRWWENKVWPVGNLKWTWWEPDENVVYWESMKWGNYSIAKSWISNRFLCEYQWYTSTFPGQSYYAIPFDYDEFSISASVLLHNTSWYQVLFRWSDSSGNDTARMYLTWYGWWPVLRIGDDETYYIWVQLWVWYETQIFVSVSKTRVFVVIDWVVGFNNVRHKTWPMQRRSNYNFSIFNRWYNPSEWISGTARDVVVWNKALTPQEYDNFLEKRKYDITYRINPFTEVYWANNYWNRMYLKRWTGTYSMAVATPVEEPWGAWYFFNNGNHIDTKQTTLPKSWTFSMWFKTPKTYTYATIASLVWTYMWYRGKAAFILWLSCRDTDSWKIGFWMRDDSGKEVNASIEWDHPWVNKWNHVVVSYNKSTKQLLFSTNGKVDYRETIDLWPINFNSLTIWWGRQPDQNIKWPFTWVIQEYISEWKAWTEAEIKEYYNRTKFKYTKVNSYTPKSYAQGWRTVQYFPFFDDYKTKMSYNVPYDSLRTTWNSTWIHDNAVYIPSHWVFEPLSVWGFEGTTVSFWMRTAHYTSQFCPFYVSWSINWGHTVYWLYVNNWNQYTFRTRDVADITVTSNRYVLTDNRFHHVVMTHDKASWTKRLFIDWVKLWEAVSPFTDWSAKDDSWVYKWFLNWASVRNERDTLNAQKIAYREFIVEQKARTEEEVKKYYEKTRPYLNY
jgi:hypothetical protein